MVPFASPIASEAFVIRFRTTWRSWVASASIVGVSRAKSIESSAFLEIAALRSAVQAGHRVGETHDLDDERPLAGVGEHLPREVGAACRGELDLLQRRPRRRARRERAASAMLVLPRITVSRLLKSCAMPPASTPSASSFWRLGEVQRVLLADRPGDRRGLDLLEARDLALLRLLVAEIGEREARQRSPVDVAAGRLRPGRGRRTPAPSTSSSSTVARSPRTSGAPQRPAARRRRGTCEASAIPRSSRAGDDSSCARRRLAYRITPAAETVAAPSRMFSTNIRYGRSAVDEREHAPARAAVRRRRTRRPRPRRSRAARPRPPHPLRRAARIGRPSLPAQACGRMSGRDRAARWLLGAARGRDPEHPQDLVEVRQVADEPALGRRQGASQRGRRDHPAWSRRAPDRRDVDDREAGPPARRCTIAERGGVRRSRAPRRSRRR